MSLGVALLVPRGDEAYLVAWKFPGKDMDEAWDDVVQTHALSSTVVAKFRGKWLHLARYPADPVGRPAALLSSLYTSRRTDGKAEFVVVVESEFFDPDRLCAFASKLAQGYASQRDVVARLATPLLRACDVFETEAVSVKASAKTAALLSPYSLLLDFIALVGPEAAAEVWRAMRSHERVLLVGADPHQLWAAMRCVPRLLWSSDDPEEYERLCSSIYLFSSSDPSVEETEDARDAGLLGVSLSPEDPAGFEASVEELRERLRPVDLIVRLILRPSVERWPLDRQVASEWEEAKRVCRVGALEPAMSEYRAACPSEEVPRTPEILNRLGNQESSLLSKLVGLSPTTKETAFAQE